MKKRRIVRQVKPHLMDGDTPLEKELNAYLTNQFVLSEGVPSDECLTEAKLIIAMVKKQTKAGD